MSVFPRRVKELTRSGKPLLLHIPTLTTASVCYYGNWCPEINLIITCQVNSILTTGLKTGFRLQAQVWFWTVVEVLWPDQRQHQWLCVNRVVSLSIQTHGSQSQDGRLREAFWAWGRKSDTEGSNISGVGDSKGWKKTGRLILTWLHTDLINCTLDFSTVWVDVMCVLRPVSELMLHF